MVIEDESRQCPDIGAIIDKNEPVAMQVGRSGSNPGARCPSSCDLQDAFARKGPFFTEEQYKQILALLNKEPTDNQHNTDNQSNMAGAIHHIAASMDLLTNDNTRTESKDTVHLPTGDKILVSHTGHAYLFGIEVIKGSLQWQVKGISRETGDLYIVKGSSNNSNRDCNVAATSHIPDDRLPSSAIKGKSPYEMLYAKPPSLTHLRVIGCLCFASVVPKGDKFAARAKESVFPFAKQQEISISHNPPIDNLGSGIFDVGVPSIGVADSSQDICQGSDVDQGLAILTTDNIVKGNTERDNELQESSPSEKITPVIQEDEPHALNQDVTTDAAHIPLRKSSRTSIQPIWLRDYVTTQKGTSKYHITNYISYDKVTPKYQSYLAKFSIFVEPGSFKQAAKDARWIEIDVYNAFLQGDLYEELYMDIPESFRRSNDQLIAEAKEILHQQFKLKDLGELKYFLGIEILRSTTGVVLNQRKYVREFISEMRLSGAKLAITPLETNIKLTTIAYDQPTGSANDSPLEDHPKKSHWEAALKVVSYLKSAPSQACPNTRRSITGYVVKFGDSLISWKSMKQQPVSKSSAEAEYRSRASAVAEVTWLLVLFQEPGVLIKLPVLVQCDSKSAIQLAANPIFHE
ncbi:PREDICTED: uncharacterized protein LOC109217131 [Nicotiana attenuata]|uniref:uncharacterized protein LOC109217131 n=1 Tax=Nicotiana attenuata TaxID=49451 RepID=UPI0009052222|nr:PREDICTED: uncharacterized protein LOC109217131 [Nicotiana attenuata]